MVGQLRALQNPEEFKSAHGATGILYMQEDCKDLIDEVAETMRWTPQKATEQMWLQLDKQKR